MKRAIIQPPLIENKSDERNKVTLVNEIRTQVALQPVFRVRGSTNGAGVLTTIWNDDVPTGAAVYVKATVIGVGNGNSAWYEIQIGIRNTAGVLSIIGATAVTVAREDAAACDAAFALAGDTVSLQVRDDAVASMNWTAYVTYLAAG